MHLRINKILALAASMAYASIGSSLMINIFDIKFTFPGGGDIVMLNNIKGLAITSISFIAFLLSSHSFICYLECDGKESKEK